MLSSAKNRESTALKLLKLLAASVAAGVLVALVVLPGVGGSAITARDAADGFMDMDVAEITRTPAEKTVVYDAKGKVLATFFDEYRENVPLEQVADVVKKAIVAIEDARFYEHGALDLKGTIRALTRNATNGGTVEGGSTLTQQLAKNMLVNNTDTEEGYKEATEATINRKLRELRLALQLEQTMTKDEILRDYLNIAYFGAGAYGIQAASKRYFNIPASKLSLAQAATLAGITKNPFALDPTLHPEAALERRDTVLARMQDLGHITPEEAAQARKQPLKLKEFHPKGGCEASQSPYFCSYVYYEMINIFMGDAKPKDDKEKQELKEAARKKLLRGGYKIYTTLDPKVQKAADQAVRYATEPTGWRVNVEAVVQPGTGKVLAIANSKKYGSDKGETTINLAADEAHGGSVYGVDAGSTFKVFTLMEALDQGLPIRTAFSSPAKTTIHGFQDCAYAYPPAVNGRLGGGSWTVGNASDSEAGSFNMKTGTWHSVNTYYAALEKEVGVCEATEMATKFGMVRTNGQPIQPIPSQVLGVNPIDMVHLAAAYAGIAARGKYCAPNVVTNAVGPDGKKIDIPAPKCEQVIDQQVADATTMILQGVISQGTARGLAIGRPAAAKTGTCENYSCAVFAGYTPNLAAATAYWDFRGGHAHPVTGIYGATIPGPVWQRTMTAALAGEPVLSFKAPVRDFGDVKEVPVPDVKGKPVEEAQAILREAGFNVRVSPRPVRSGERRGTVARVSPSKAEPGTTVTIYVSGGRRGGGGDGDEHD
ncbi:transglycosylase domain-containing protein [Actinocorallia sp. API 0066]|uniref:penicillin-binding protein n=1 Tax=Actinocorallia sp. API 0066 TaxID=2896846 RepID=UPI001E36BF7C|nr:transglycosylase domain-containing protein [Actinocorallia sp. API 0066]MCD0450654.1 transglycosylase domain-containing protein [Actinocorallia sp. API 0066]